MQTSTYLNEVMHHLMFGPSAFKYDVILKGIVVAENFTASSNGGPINILYVFWRYRLLVKLQTCNIKASSSNSNSDDRRDCREQRKCRTSGVVIKSKFVCGIYTATFQPLECPFILFYDSVCPHNAKAINYHDCVWRFLSDHLDNFLSATPSPSFIHSSTHSHLISIPPAPFTYTYTPSRHCSFERDGISYLRKSPQLTSTTFPMSPRCFHFQQHPQ